MIDLKDYLKVDEEKNRFSLPLSFWGQMKYLLTVKFLENLGFAGSMFIGDDKVKKYYWRIVLNYIQTTYKSEFSVHKVFFKSRFLQYAVNIWFPEEEGFKKNIKGHGNSSTDDELAISKAIGEFLERYTTCVVSAEELKNVKVMNLGEIKKQAKIVRDFHGYSALQLENNPNIDIKDEDVFEVLPVQDMSTGKSIFYPLRQIFWNNYKHGGGEKTIANLTTSGCAGGFTLEDATLGAFYESIERDSFFCYWQTKASPQKIKINDGEIEEYDGLKKFLREVGCELFILNTTTELNIFSCICVVVDIKTKGIVLSGAAGTNFQKVLKNALNEVRACLSIFSGKEAFELAFDYKPFITKDLNRTERLSFWQGGKHFDKLDFLFKGEEVNFLELTKNDLFFEDKTQELEFLISKVKNLGGDYESIYRYVTKDESLKKLGFFVVRVIIPKLYQLYLSEDLSLTNSKRIDEFYKWKTGKEDAWTINTMPHPFP